MKVSDHFEYEEFCKRDQEILTPVQMYMLINLCQNILEPIRSHLCVVCKRDVSIKVVSGIRFPSDNNRIRAQGFNPSETSDHLFGNIVKLHNAVKIRKYGKYYQFSVGAADIIPDCGADRAWDILLPFFNRNTSTIDLPGCSIPIGQVILEKRKTFWLHISNPKRLIFTEQVVETYLKSEPFLKSLDNGCTYNPI